MTENVRISPGGSSAAAVPGASDRLAVTRERVEWIDALRITAAFAVISLHVSEPILLGDGTAIDGQWWTGNVMNAATRWCVPAFIMISGMLLLPRAGGGSEWAFYRRRASRILIPLVFWTAFYLLWLAARGDHVSMRRLLVLLLFGKTYYHLWFLYMLLGLYLAAPFLGVFVAAAGRRTVWLATAVGFGLASSQLLTEAMRASESWSPVFLSWTPFTTYFLAGYILADRRHIRISKPLLLTALAVAIALTALSTGLLWPVLSARTRGLTHNCFNPLIVVMSMAVFLLFRDWRASPVFPGHRFVTGAAPFTLGIYLIHPLCIELLAYFGITATAIPVLIGVPLYSILVFCLSLVGCMGLAMLPGGRRLVM